MKKMLLISVVFAVFTLSCGTVKGDSAEGIAGGIVDVSEAMFATQMLQISHNPNDYLGRTIRLEGVYRLSHFGGRDIHTVFRFGPGCCGPMKEFGFEMIWNSPYEDAYGENLLVFPSPNDWVEAVGVLSYYLFMGFPFLYLNLLELNVLEVRGAEIVTN